MFYTKKDQQRLADLERKAMLKENSPINKESLQSTMEELIERTRGYSADIYEHFEGLYKLYRMMRTRVETLEKQCPPKPTPKSRSKPSSDRKLTGTKSRQPRKASGAK